MKYSYLPNKFTEFDSVFDQLYKFRPINISIIGSYGDKNKTPDEASDLDMIFVFDTNNIYNLNSEISNEFDKIQGLRIIKLGVHFQFGFVYSIYYEKKPMKWLDLGIMDSNFANNYLVNFPKKDVKGSINPSANKEIPNNHLNHLARKITKYLHKGKLLQAKIASYRYLNWLNVENKIRKLKNNEQDNEFARIYNNKLKLNDKETLEYVLNDIKKREPSIWGQINQKYLHQ